MTRVAILRCGRLPSFVTWEIPDLDELFEEDNLLARGFQEKGIDAAPVVWSATGIDWDSFDIALVRSTWDYLDERDHFLKVLSDIETSGCRLFNPLPVIRWNIDKRYLFDLQSWGIAVIPTLLASGTRPEQYQRMLADHQPHMAILKPTVGLGGSYSQRIPLADLEETLEKLRASQPETEYLIQPYIEDIVTEGEWSFIYFNHQLSHVLLKRPAPGDYRVQGIYGGTVQTAEPGANDRSQAENVMAKIPFDVLYARLDFVRVSGQLSVIEVELIEPIFSFHLVPAAIPRFVQATLSKFVT